MKKKARPSSAAADNKHRSILTAFLLHVPFDGWTETSYAAALQQLKMQRAEADKIFPQALRDLAEAFGAMIDETMRNRIEAERGFDRMRVRDKVTFAVRARLEGLNTYREALRRLMMWYTLPHHAPLAIRRFYKTVDLIWRAAGDTSTDYNFYTKRILLSGVLKLTILFWLNDESPDHKATWEFLDRRIADVMKLGKSISLLKEFKPAEIASMVRDKIRKAM